MGTVLREHSFTADAVDRAHESAARARVVLQVGQHMGSRTGMHRDGQAALPDKRSSVPTAAPSAQCLRQSGGQLDQPIFIAV